MLDKRKQPMSEEHKKKISDAQKGKPRLYAVGNKYACGKEPWNKGKHWSDEFKKTMSDKLKGKCLNTGRTHIKKGQHLSVDTQFGNKEAWNKGKKNPYFTGENNPNWKGGITPENHKIRTSLEYKEWRNNVFTRDNYTCQECGIKGGWHKDVNKKITLNAHHLEPFSINPELRFEIDNGITLCRECHKKTKGFGINFIRYNLSLTN